MAQDLEAVDEGFDAGFGHAETLGELGVGEGGGLAEEGGFEEVEAFGGAVGEGFGAELSEGADERGGGSIGVVKRGGGGGINGLDAGALGRF